MKSFKSHFCYLCWQIRYEGNYKWPFPVTLVWPTCFRYTFSFIFSFSFSCFPLLPLALSKCKHSLVIVPAAANPCTVAARGCVHSAPVTRVASGSLLLERLCAPRYRLSCAVAVCDFFKSLQVPRVWFISRSAEDLVISLWSTASNMVSIIMLKIWSRALWSFCTWDAFWREILSYPAVSMIENLDVFYRSICDWNEVHRCRETILHPFRNKLSDRVTVS